MSNSELFNLAATIIAPMIGIIGGAFAIIKIFFRYKSKILFITNCQILHRTIWADLVSYYGPKEINWSRYPSFVQKLHDHVWVRIAEFFGYKKLRVKGLQDHAFRPLVLLPEYLKKYIQVKNGNTAVLESINPNSDNNIKIIAEVYWIPKKGLEKRKWKDEKELERMKDWAKISHPVFSLILRRYFGIERPMYQDEKAGDLDSKKWKLVRHSTAHLDLLHRVDRKNSTMMQWAMSSEYTKRYFNPGKGETGKYDTSPNKNNFIEYCGFSISLRKRSWLQIEKE